MMNGRYGIILLMALAGALGVATSPALALEAEVRLSQESAYVGEAVTMQIVVKGSESPEPPDLSGMTDFSVSFQGGSQNSSRSISIINGRMTQEVNEGYVFSYQITPVREGVLVIPAITVRAGGQTALTRPVRVQARTPRETGDFKLRMRLSQGTCYVGEPVTLTVTWYLSGEVESANFSLPFLNPSGPFAAADPKIDTATGGPYYKIPSSAGELIAAKGQGDLDGQPFATLWFQKILIPKKPGRITLDPAAVSYKALTGYRTNRRDPFDDDFFSNFFRQNLRQGVYQQGVSPSNALTLEVREVPAEGRPADFSGLVGTYQMEATATPTTVNVGDPITLTVTLSGPEYLDPVELPPLNRQTALAKDFKVPEERAAGEIQGGRKIFTQTIRPLRAEVRAVPALTLSYFNTYTGAYDTLRTRPIPLVVNPTRVVTEKDAEGPAEAGPAGSEVESLSFGLNHNYDDDSVLRSQIHDPAAWAKTPTGMAALALPPALYGLLTAGAWAARRKKASPGAALAKKAGARLGREVRAALENPPDTALIVILEAFKTYLRSKLRLPPGALTFQDAAQALSRLGADATMMDAVKALFADGEAARFGGARPMGGPEGMAERALGLAKQLERIVK